MPRASNIAKTMTSNGKQFTVTREILNAVAGISARYSKFAFVLLCYITNHLMTNPLGKSEFCFPRISMFPSTSSRETLRFSGNKIHCSPRDQSLSVYCFPRISMFLSTSSRDTSSFEESKIQLSSMDQSFNDFISYFLFSKTKKANFENRAEIAAATSGHLQLNAQIAYNKGRHFAGNSELSPVWRHSFRYVARSWHLAVNSFIVRCHVNVS